MKKFSLFKNEMNLTNGNLFVKIIIFMIPLILSGVLQLLFNSADLIIVGKFGGGNSQSAVGSTGSLVNLIVNVFMGFSVGANVTLGRAYGSNDKEKGQRILHTAIILSVISGVIVTIVGCSGSYYFLSLMGTPAEVLDKASLYLTIYFAGMPFLMIFNFGAALLRSVGDSKRPLYFMAISGALNVLLNLLFVIVCKLDVAGVALATVISEGVAAALILVCLANNKGFIKLNFKELKLHKQELIELTRIGLPAGIQGSIFSISNVLIQSSINSFGTIALNGNTVSSNIENYIYTSMNSVAVSCVAFTSANYGAKNKENLRKSYIYSLILIICIGVLLGGLFYLLNPYLIALYTDNAEVAKFAFNRMVIFCLTYWICGIMDVSASYERGLGYSFTPMIVSLLGACVLRIVFIYTLFQLPEFHSLTWLYFSYPISWIITSISHVVCILIIKKKAISKMLEKKESTLISEKN